MKNVLSKFWKAISRDPKTSIAGIVGFIATFLAHFNIIFPESLQTLIGSATFVIVSVLAADGGEGEKPE